MIFKTIWERYLFKKLFLSFFLFLISLYSVYIFIDLSTQSGRLFFYGSCSFSDLLFYYLKHFLLRANLFFFFSFFLAQLSTLLPLNQHGELTALRMGGVSFIKITRPFFLFAFLLFILSTVNFEVLYPHIVKEVENFQDTNLKKLAKHNRFKASCAYLKDGSKIIFQKSPHSNIFFDVYWIQSMESIYHMKELHLFTDYAQGKAVDVFKKTSKGFQLVTSYPQRVFSDFTIHSSYKNQPPESLPLSTLLKIASIQSSTLEEKAFAQTNLFFKFGVSLLPILLVLSLSPIYMLHRKKINHFALISLSLFAFISFYLLLETATILAENQVLSPTIAFLVPLSLAFLVGGKLFLKEAL